MKICAVFSQPERAGLAVGANFLRSPGKKTQWDIDGY
jgi:hypothetical protein